LPIEREETPVPTVEVVDGGFRPVPRTEMPRLASEKRIIPVLLCYPTYDEVLRKVGGKIQPLRNGDVLFGKKFYTPSALEEVMKREQNL
jgi:hypothetical protein